MAAVIAALMVPVAAATMQLLAVGCIGRVAFDCDTDAQCNLGEAGRCLPGGCAAVDTECPSGYRYSEHTPQGAVCTEDDTVAEGSTAAASGSDDVGSETGASPTTDTGSASEGGTDDATGGTTGGGDDDCTVSIAAGLDAVCALDGAGRVRCWSTTADHPVVLKNGALVAEQAQSIAVGDEHACLVDENDKPRCWGNNQSQAYSEIEDSSPTPIEVVDGSMPSAVTAITADRASTCFHGDAVYCVGRAADAIDQDANGVFLELGGRVPLEVAVGSDHVCVLDTDGDVGCAGTTDQGQLGGMAMVQTLETGLNLTDGMGLSVAGDSNCVLTASPTMTCWGRNSNRLIVFSKEQRVSMLF
ncbi:MAG: RCC1 domain-containing protein [Myxococcota bacterium]